jgi:hypothetical protein
VAIAFDGQRPCFLLPVEMNSFDDYSMQEFFFISVYLKVLNIIPSSICISKI